MRLDREKTLVDEGCDVLVSVRLGFQPSTSPSFRSRAEVEQNRPAGFPRLPQSGIDIPAPLNCHSVILYRYYLAEAPREALSCRITVCPTASQPMRVTVQ